MIRVGIMQGRLSPPSGGRIQSFPVDTWREEFTLGREAAIDCIEWIYEKDSEVDNPLWSESGTAEIRRVARESGVAVRSVCGDHYMTDRLIGTDGEPQQEVVEHLQWLIKRVSSVGAGYLVLPFVDSSSLQSPREIDGLLAMLRDVLPDIEMADIELHLETDLKPRSLTKLLNDMSSPRIRATYDMGNSASLGHDPLKELPLIGPFLGSVHVKDRILGGGTVPLTTGSTNFEACFKLIGESGFDGPYILQAARDESISEVDLAIKNRQFVEEQVANAASGR